MKKLSEIWYPSDFEYLKSRNNAVVFNPGLQLFYATGPEKLNQSQSKVFQTTTASSAAIMQKSNSGKRKRKKRHQYESMLKIIVNYWKSYCMRTHVHGVKYLVDEKTRVFERLLMAVVLIAYIFGTVYVSILFSYKFSESALKINVESTAHPIYYIDFPAFTICNYHRVNWSKFAEAQKKFLPANASRQTIDLFQQFVGQFETFAFGQFSLFGKFENQTLKELDGINITEVMEFLAYRCNDLFQACSWKNRIVSCCELFVLQKSESGFCLTFNSMTSPAGAQKQKYDMFYPYHVATAGFDSALKVYIVLDKNKRSPFNRGANNGVAIMLHRSYQWPMEEQFIPVNTNVSISIDARLSYAGVDTYGMNPDVRDCLFEHELKKQFKYRTLYGLKYSKSNCIAQCHQQFVMGICNCSLDLLYPTDRNHEVCRASDFKCFYKYRNVLKQNRGPDEELYINYTDDGIRCRCLSECYSIDFDAKILPIAIPNMATGNNLGYISIDLFYEKSTILKYRIDLEFDLMDLLVAYGGIAGLFIGFSLFSGFELTYYMTIGFILHLYDKGCCSGETDDDNDDDHKFLINNISGKKTDLNENNDIKVIRIKVKPSNKHQDQSKITDIVEY